TLLDASPSSRHNKCFGGAYAGLWVCSVRDSNACPGGNRSHVQHGIHSCRSVAPVLRFTDAPQAALGAGSASDRLRRLPDPRTLPSKPYPVGPASDLG